MVNRDVCGAPPFTGMRLGIVHVYMHDFLVCFLLDSGVKHSLLGQKWASTKARVGIHFDYEYEVYNFEDQSNTIILVMPCFQAALNY